MHFIAMDSFPIQNYENKMETFETYNESAATAANRQRDIVQTQPVNSQASVQQIQVQSQENRDALALQQQQQQQHQTHQMTQIQSNTEQGTTLTPVRLPAILDGEYFAVTRVEESNVTVRCQQCQKLLNGNLKSTGNFLSHIKRLHPTLIEKIRCKSNQRKPAMVYIDSMLSDKCSEIRKRVVIQSKKRCKTEDCATENEEPYEHQPGDWNDAQLIRRRSEETESTDLSVRIPHNNSFVVEDEYDAIGRNVAAKLRNMRLDQRIIAEKLLNDILFEAQLGNLRRDSSIHV